MSIKDLPQGLVDSVKELLAYQAGMNEGKYAKYSDLLLQKGRALDDGSKPDSAAIKKIDKLIHKQLVKLGIEEEDDSAYQKFFRAALKKYGVSSPAELEGEKEKEFYAYIEKNWTKDEESITEAKKGKYKSPKASKITQEIGKIEKREKKSGDKNSTKLLAELGKMVKQGLETELYDDMEILSKKTLKKLDHVFMDMDTMPREEAGAIIKKYDEDLYEMIFGY